MLNVANWTFIATNRPNCGPPYCAVSFLQYPSTAYSGIATNSCKKTRVRSVSKEKGSMTTPRPSIQNSRPRPVPCVADATNREDQAGWMPGLPGLVMIEDGLFFGGSNGLDRSKLPRLGGNSPSPVYHGYSSIRVSTMRFRIYDLGFAIFIEGLG